MSLARRTASRLPESVQGPLRRAAERLRPGKAPQNVPPANLPASYREDVIQPDPDRVLQDALLRGEGAASAVVKQVRAFIKSKQHDAAISLGHSLREHRETADLGRLAVALAAASQRNDVLVWDQLRQVPPATWAHWMPMEYVRLGLRFDPEGTESSLRSLVEDASVTLPVRAWFEVAAGLFGVGRQDLSREAFTRFDNARHANPNEWRHDEHLGEWLRPWLEVPAHQSAEATDGSVSLGVMDYSHPDRWNESINVGDHVQTLASIGHIARHSGLEFHGVPDLVDMMQRFQSQVPERLQIDSGRHRVDLTVYSRDASMHNAIPDNSWAIVFGWFLHPIFGLRTGIPFHRNLRPIIVSFHCNDLSLLTPEAVEYLRTVGPIGCRDWTTADLLLSLDVPAFFSGCMTTTVSTTFPDQPPAPSDSPVANVEAPASAGVPEGSRKFKQQEHEMRERTFVENQDYVWDLLNTYRTEFSSVSTKRLHAYLPSRSLGLPVDFHPVHRNDVRFSGLLDLGEAEFEAIRGGLMDSLAPVVTEIVSGAPEAQVRERWAAVTAEAVAAARNRFETPVAVPAPPVELTEAVHALRERAGGEQAPYAVVIPVTPGQVPRVRVLIESIARATDEQVNVVLLARKDISRPVANLQAEFPEVTLSWIDGRSVASGLSEDAGRLTEIYAAEILSLPELLPGVERAVVLPMAALVTGDIAELIHLDLDGHLLAAASDRALRPWSGTQRLRAASLRQVSPELADDLRRLHSARNGAWTSTLETEVLVLDLAQMRETGFTESALGMASHFGLGLNETLTLMCGPNRKDLAPEWAYDPTRHPELSNARVTYWVDGVRPWHERYYVAGQNAWRSVQQDLRERREASSAS